MTLSPVEAIALAPDAEIDDLLADLREMSDADLGALIADWRFHARPEQLAPTDVDWRWWLVKAGRGFGKTRTGAEWVVDRAEAFAAAGVPHLIGLLNRSFDQVRSLQIDGESGLRAVCARRGHRLDIAPTSLHGRLLIKTDRGVHESAIEIHTGDDPDRVRGRNFHTLWCDEVAAWRHKVDETGNTAFTNADLGLRALCPPGLDPQGVITTTPKAISLLVDLVAGKWGELVITEGSTFDNLANLHPAFVQSVLRNYVGTRLAAQEIFGRLVVDVEGALWRRSLIDRTRRDLHGQPARGSIDDLRAHDERVVGVDPPGGLRTECGIIVAGRWSADDLLRPHADVIDDLSLAGAPEDWGAEVVRAYHLHGCDSVVAEVNFGGEMVRSTIHAIDPTVPVRMVRASRGKQARAEPVAVLYDANRVHHVGTYGELESEQTTWVPADKNAPSPNRLDALVWAVSYLLPLHDATGLAQVGSPAAPTDVPATLGRSTMPYSGKVR